MNNDNQIHSLQEVHTKKEGTMPKIKMSDAEKIERWNIANMFIQIDPYILSIIINDAAAHFTGGFVDSGGLNYGAVLGFEYKNNNPIKIEILREIAELVRERLYGKIGEQ